MFITPLRKLAKISFYTFFFNLLFAIPVKAEDLVDKEVPRIRDAESIFLTAIVALWALSIPYFLFNVVYIGFLYMTSLGDENKAAAAKQRGGKLILSAVILFGGWVIVKFLMTVLGLKGAGDCMDSPLPNPMIKFFFENPC